ncbi:MAG: hypothetical protein Q8L65_16005 [Burkholderiales bacterium]|nr:hypothetical protein [Burkholderiales bacterium]
MKPQTILAIILIAAGSIGLAYGGYTYTRETTGMKRVPLELKVRSVANRRVQRFKRPSALHSIAD